MSIKPLDYLRELRAARHPELTPSVKLVLAMVVTHAGEDGTEAHPGIVLSAAETGLSESTVKRSLQTARRLGWLLQVSSGRGGNHDKASVYHLAVPKGTGDTLGKDPTGTGDTLGSFVKRSRAKAQRVTDDIPKGTGDLTDALRDDPGNDPALHRGRRRGKSSQAADDAFQLFFQDVPRPRAPAGFPEYRPEPEYPFQPEEEYC